MLRCEYKDPNSPAPHINCCDSFGSDPEDFAILHFVEVTCCSSHEAIEIESCGLRLKDRTIKAFSVL